MWSIVSDYYGVVQGKLQAFQAKLLKIVGIELVDVHALPIDKHTPDQVNAKIKYWRRYLLALLPMVTLLALFVALHFVRKESSFTEAVYFGVVTATTVGFGDFGFLDEEPLNKCLAALGVMGVVVVFANAVDECLLIRKRQQLRHGKIAALAEQLEALINGKRNAGEGDYISEADYVVETLLKGDLVDPQIYWPSAGALLKAHAASDGKRNSLITSATPAARRGSPREELDSSIARRHAIGARRFDA